MHYFLETYFIYRFVQIFLSFSAEERWDANSLSDHIRELLRKEHCIVGKSKYKSFRQYINFKKLFI